MRVLKNDEKVQELQFKMKINFFYEIGQRWSQMTF